MVCLKIVRNWLLAVSLLAFGMSAVATEYKITNVDLVAPVSTNPNATLKITFDKNYPERPDIKINGYMYQLEIYNSAVWPKVEKVISKFFNGKDVTLLAYQYSKEMVRIRLVFPDKIDHMANSFVLIARDRTLEVSIPTQGTAAATEGINNVSDEKYLQTLIDKEQSKEKVKASPLAAHPTNKPMPISEKNKSRPSLGFGSYLLKFALFMVLILAVFYALVLLFKKSVLSNGKLNFLKNSSAVTVLSNTYIAPKRSILTIKVHNQVFLIGNSEGGIHLISELKDVNGIVKEAERAILGSNFDTAIEKVESHPRHEGKVKLKAPIHNYIETKDEEIERLKLAGSITADDGMADDEEFKVVQDKVHFSNEIKEKLKKMRNISQ